MNLIRLRLFQLQEKQSWKVSDPIHWVLHDHYSLEETAHYAVQLIAHAEAFDQGPFLFMYISVLHFGSSK